MVVPTVLKDNPVKSAISVLTLVSMLVGTILTVDSRYAKAADLQSQNRVIEQSSKETKYAIDQLRKQSLGDKIFELELIPETKRTTIEKARLEKAKRDMQDIDNKWLHNSAP